MYVSVFFVKFFYIYFDYWNLYNTFVTVKRIKENNMCSVCLNGTYPDCPVCSQDVLPRVNATITIVDNENQLEFDCPNCGSFNEIHTCDDDNIADMKVNHEYDYECMYCTTKLELIIR